MDVSLKIMELLFVLETQKVAMSNPNRDMDETGNTRWGWDLEKASF